MRGADLDCSVKFSAELMIHPFVFAPVSQNATLTDQTVFGWIGANVNIHDSVFRVPQFPILFVCVSWQSF